MISCIDFRIRDSLKKIAAKDVKKGIISEVRNQSLLINYDHSSPLYIQHMLYFYILL